MSQLFFFKSWLIFRKQTWMEYSSGCLCSGEEYRLLKGHQVPTLEKAMATHSSTLAWEIPWAEEPGRLQSMGLRTVGHMTERLHFHFSLSCIGEGNGNPLQCSCLENPRDGGAWWAAVSGVAQSQTQLKRLSSSSSSNRAQYFLVGMKEKRWDCRA